MRRELIIEYSVSMYLFYIVEEYILNCICYFLPFFYLRFNYLFIPRLANIESFEKVLSSTSIVLVHHSYNVAVYLKIKIFIKKCIFSLTWRRCMCINYLLSGQEPIREYIASIFTYWTGYPRNFNHKIPHISLAFSLPKIYILPFYLFFTNERPPPTTFSRANVP